MGVWDEIQAGADFFAAMAKDILGEAGLHFDELNKLRVLDPEVTQQTIELKEECKDFVDSEYHLETRCHAAWANHYPTLTVSHSWSAEQSCLLPGFSLLSGSHAYPAFSACPLRLLWSPTFSPKQHIGLRERGWAVLDEQP